MQTPITLCIYINYLLRIHAFEQLLQTHELSLLFKTYNEKEDNCVLIKFLLSFALQAYKKEVDIITKKNEYASNLVRHSNDLNSKKVFKFIEQKDRLRELILLFPISIMDMKLGGREYLSIIYTIITFIFKNKIFNKNSIIILINLFFLYYRIYIIC